MRAQQTTGTRALVNSEIERLRRILEVHREEALTALSRLEDETRTVDSNCPQDVADLTTTSLSKESLFQRGSERRRLLRMIERALARIQQGTFGVCSACGDGINPRRLDALPWTQHCLRCQEEMEREEMQASRDRVEQRFALKKAG